MPAPHHSVFYRPDALPATQPTASKHFALFNTTHMQKALQPHNCTANKTVQIPNMTWYWNYCYTNCKYKSILSVYSLVRDDWGLKGVEHHATVDNPPAHVISGLLDDRLRDFCSCLPLIM